MRKFLLLRYPAGNTVRIGSPRCQIVVCIEPQAAVHRSAETLYFWIRIMTAAQNSPALYRQFPTPERSPLLKEIITMLSRKYPSVRMPRKLSATVCWQSIPTSSPLTRMPWQRMTALCRWRKIPAILQNLSMFPTT